MRLLSIILFAVLAGCVQAPPWTPNLASASAHLQAPPPEQATSVARADEVFVAPAQAGAPEITYSLDVRLVPVEQLLTAIARDHRIDFDLHPGVEGFVSLSAFDCPLSKLFERICEQAALRCVFDGQRLSAMPDTPFLQAYRVDYVNIARDMNAAVATSTQIATSTSGVDGANNSNGGGNTSLTRIETRATNHFWEALEANIRAILKEDGRNVRKPRCEALRRRAPDGGNGSGNGSGSGSGKENGKEKEKEKEKGNSSVGADCAAVADDASSVVSNRESGILMVLASAAQHRKVAEFIDLVQGSARQQVMIEATIVEVTLADGYRQGIDWSRLGGPDMAVRPRGANDASAMTPTVSYLSGLLDIRLDWLESFGTVKVLSSPRLSVLNNQTAILKVVEEVVYFLVDASTTEYGNSDREKITASTKPQSVSVGLIMALTPQIGRDGEITLDVRPTISSISGFKDDPNPSLGSIPNRVPQIRTREIESVLRLADGEIAVLGGLMEDKIDYDTGRIPLLGALPLLGEVLTRRENSMRRTELAIFLRPRLIRHPGLNGDYAPERAALPDAAFLRTAPVPGRRNFPDAREPVRAPAPVLETP